MWLASALRHAGRIRILRFHHSETLQADLRKRIGLTRQTIAVIEAGKYSPPFMQKRRVEQPLWARHGRDFAMMSAHARPEKR
jgi:DNA-binding XRE family transcriptional regulator